MKVKLIITNYVKFGNPWNIKIGDKVLLGNLKHNLHPSSFLPKNPVIVFKVFGKYFQITKSCNKMNYWSKHRIKCNYSNYKFEVL